jgi:hypothetical protein
MRGFLIVLLLGAVPGLFLVMALVLDESSSGNIAAYGFMVSLALWATAIALLLAVVIVRRRRVRSSK